MNAGAAGAGREFGTDEPKLNREREAAKFNVIFVFAGVMNRGINR